MLVLILGGLYAGYDYRRARANQTAAALAAVDARIAALATTRSPTAIDAQLDAAEAALENAARSGVAGSALRSRREAIADIRDRVNHVTRLTDLARIGSLPAGVDRSSLHLLGDGDRLYFVADAIYRVDVQTQTLTLLLAPGATIGKRTVGPSLTAALDGDILTVSDGRTLYRLAPDGDWEAAKLGTSRRGTGGETAASGAYLGSFYVLDAAGVILKYPAERLGSRPQVWLKEESGPLLEDARDMVVDRGIHVLTAGGEIVSYFRGLVDDSFRLEVEPPLADPVALAGGPETESLYLAETNGTEGRLLRFDRNGGEVRQYLFPLPWQDGWSASAADEFAHLADVAVDETGGVVYFVGRDAIWRATIPPDEVAS
jgi:hypothetical protein